MYHVSAQGVDERMINVHNNNYYYYRSEASSPGVTVCRLQHSAIQLPVYLLTITHSEHRFPAPSSLIIIIHDTSIAQCP